MPHNSPLHSQHKRPVSSDNYHVFGVIRWEPPFTGVSSSWSHDTSRRLDSDHWRPSVTPLMPAITAPHTKTTSYAYATAISTIITYTSRFSNQTHLDSPIITDITSHHTTTQANSPGQTAWSQRGSHRPHSPIKYTSWISSLFPKSLSILSAPPTGPCTGVKKMCQ